MKTTIKSLGIAIISSMLLLVSCQKDTTETEIATEPTETTITDQDLSMFLTSKGMKAIVVVPLEKPADYAYYTKGTIKFVKGNETVAVLDYGNGELDHWAIKKADGKIYKIDLSKKDCCKGKDKGGKCTKGDKGDKGTKGDKGDKGKYKKVISKPLVKAEGCNYITEGTIKFFYGTKWVATIDYGDGTCDNIATKTWKGGSKVITL